MALMGLPFPKQTVLMVKKSDTGAIILKKLLNIYIYLQFTEAVLRLARLEACEWRFNKVLAKHTTQNWLSTNVG